MSVIHFARAVIPTPLLNTPDFCSTFSLLPLDDERLLRAVEAVAFPGTKFRVLAAREHPHIIQVSTSEYPYEGTFFTDGRFLEITAEEPLEREIVLPSIEEIVARLDALVGAPYIWGGNWPDGIPQLFDYYPSSVIDPTLLDIKCLRGVDCTGMLYFACNGYTPRNTSKFVSWGRPVSIEGLSIEQILTTLRPLDVIVWKGHLVCVYDQETAIESLPIKGVIKTPLRARLEEIFIERKPANEAQANTFVVRRWI